MSSKARRLSIAGIGLCLLALAPATPMGEDGAATGDNSASASEAIPAAAFSGMHVAITAGQKDGEVYAFAHSLDWTDGRIIKTFSDANRLKSTDRAPEVIDLDQSIALANESMSAPDQREMSDSLPDVKSPDDLVGNEFKGTVVVPNINAAQVAGAATSGVITEPDLGGSTDNVPPGVEYLLKPEDASRLLPVTPTLPTVQSEQSSPSSTTGSTSTPP